MSNNLTGALFKAKNKRKDTDNDYNGSVTVNGVDYWLNGWIKTPKNGGPAYISLNLKAKNQTQQKGEQEAKKPETHIAPPPFPTEGADEVRPLNPIDPDSGDYYWEGDK